MEQGTKQVETRLAVVAIVVEDLAASEEMNRILHDYSAHIIGRMGIPYHEKQVSLVSVAVDAPVDTISAMTGRLGKVKGLSVKAAYSKV